MYRTRLTQVALVLSLLLPVSMVNGDSRKTCIDGAQKAEDACVASDLAAYNARMVVVVGYCADCVSLNSSRPGGNTVKGTGRAGCYAQVAAGCGANDACVSAGDQQCDSDFGTQCDAGSQPPAGDSGTVCGNAYLDSKTLAVQDQVAADEACTTTFVDACISCPAAGQCGANTDCYDGYDNGIYCGGNKCVPCTDSGFTCPSGQTCDSYSGKCAARGDCPDIRALDGSGACTSNCGACQTYDSDSGQCVSTCSSSQTCVNGTCQSSGITCSGSCGTCGTYVLEAGATACTCVDSCANGGCPIGSCSQDSDCNGNICSGGCCMTDESGGGGSGGGGEGDSCSGDGDCSSGYSCGCGKWCTNTGPCPEDTDDPILIDLSGAGFPMTDARDGVRFNFSGSGRTEVSWTAKGADIGWLVLDLNGNGRIDDGAELFSNFSPQPSGRSGKNGFKALAVYDQAANGGNQDGWITEKDSVYSKLRIWVDRNHNGKSELDELITLRQAGVKAISVQYTGSRWADTYGNQFRYRGQIVWDKPVNGQTTAAIYDVILVTGR